MGRTNDAALTASKILNLSGVVDVGGSLAPTAGQVLTAIDATTAGWSTISTDPVDPSLDYNWTGTNVFLDTGFFIRDSGLGSQRLKFDVTGGAGVTGTILTAFTTAKTITLPDVTGTAAVISASRALGGGSTATLGTIGGSGPATATQNSWQEVKLIDGSTAWVPVWK